MFVERRVSDPGDRSALEVQRLLGIARDAKASSVKSMLECLNPCRRGLWKGVELVKEG